MSGQEQGYRDDYEPAEEQQVQELLDSVRLVTRAKNLREAGSLVFERVVHSTSTRTKVLLAEDGTRIACRYFPRGAEQDAGERRMAPKLGVGPEQGLMGTIHVVPDYENVTNIREEPATYYRIRRIPQTGILAVTSELLVPETIRNAPQNSSDAASELVTMGDILPMRLQAERVEEQLFRRQTRADLVSKAEIRDVTGLLTSRTLKTISPNPQRRQR